MNKNLIENQIDTLNNENHIVIFEKFINEQNDIKKHLNNTQMSFENKIELLPKFNEIGRFISIGYEDGVMATNDDIIFHNGGLPRSSLLIAALDNFSYDNVKIPHHFILLKISDNAPLPLSQEMTKTYLDWSKKSNPELDDYTKSDLKWTALKCEIKGQFYINAELKQFEYASDLNFQLSPLKYIIYKPNTKLLNVILNNQFLNNNNAILPIELGEYRATENLMNIMKKEDPIKIYIDGMDLLASRTAMFGKTRLGKSNTVKLLIKNLTEQLKFSKSPIKLGQLIFDVNGEYAYSNEQDSKEGKAGCIRDIFKDDCIVYSLNKRNPENKDLKINFYEELDSGLKVIASLLKEDDSSSSNYMVGFMESNLPKNLQEIYNGKDGEKIHLTRKALIYWAILYKSNFEIDSKIISKMKKINGNSLSLKLNKTLNNEIFGKDSNDNSGMTELLSEIETIANHEGIYELKSASSKNQDKSEKSFFDEDEKMLLGMFKKGRSGINLIKQYAKFHSKDANDFEIEIMKYLADGKIVILDLSNALDNVRRFFSNKLSLRVFKDQESLFTNDQLKNRYIQIYFEEAHNIFPNDNGVVDIYSRFAKEGAKFNIGIVYSTQSPSTINKELLNQTENFFIGHMSSPQEVKSLANLNVEFIGAENDILKIKQKGFMRVLTNSHRFVIPIQIKIYNN
jgi:hypothetical protein